MADAREMRHRKWPLRLVLSLLLLIEALFIVKASAEDATGNLLMIVNSAAIFVFCLMTWRGIPWSRWLLIAFLGWRVVRMVVDAVSHLAPGDHRIAGTALLLLVYVAAGLLIASPLGRSGGRAAT